MVLMIGLLVVFSLTEGTNPAMYIVVFILIILPCILAMCWVKRYKITVEGRRITVRKGFGFKFSLDVSEIVRVQWKTSLTVMGRNEKITVRTASKKFTVETLMIESETMMEYLKENVAAHKISTTVRNFNRQNKEAGREQDHGEE